MIFLYCSREQSTCKSPMAASVSGADGELVKENQQPNPEMVIQHLRSRVNEQMLNEAKLELQVLSHVLHFLKVFPYHLSTITTVVIMSKFQL